jgi:hypothetical protein
MSGIRFDTRSTSATERSPCSNAGLPICRFRYTKARKEWSLYWRHRHLKFHEYDLVEPTPHIDELIDEVKRDPAGIFWG